MSSSEKIDLATFLASFLLVKNLATFLATFGENLATFHQTFLATLFDNIITSFTNLTALKQPHLIILKLITFEYQKLDRHLRGGLPVLP